MSNPGEYQEILYDVKGRILTITFNRPDKLNAFTRSLIEELLDALDCADADDAVRAIIFTGAGRGYCAGADLSGGAGTFDREIDDEIDWADQRIRDMGGVLTLRMFRCTKPIIAAVNGPAVGIGATMQLAADIRLASETAKFGFVFSRRGIIPEACSSWFLPRIVGISKALEWTYSGEVFSVQEAKEAGLVRSIYPSDQLMPEAIKLAREFTESTSAISVALTRQMMWRMLGADHPMEAHKIDSRSLFATGQMADAKEGVAAFLEKRSPDFSLAPSKDMPSFYPWWQERDYE